MLYASPKSPLRQIQHLAPAYVSSFSLLVEDLQRLTQYVQPADANEAVYSHRIYELLLRACTEWESLCREVLQVWEPPPARVRMNVNYYRKALEPKLTLAGVRVGLRFWSPSTRYVSPFDGWAQREPPLQWYAAYNAVKHNRNSEFAQATLNTLCLAMAGLYATMDSCHWVGRKETVGYCGPKEVEMAARGWPFSSVNPTT